VWSVSESQKVEQVWETPSLEEIPVISRAHVEAMQSSDDDAVWSQAGMHHVLITMVGRKTGNEHKVALPFWRDPDGNRIVVASFAGAANHPSWYVNLSDRAANPEILVQVQGGRYWSVPEFLAGEEYDQVWQLLTADRAWYLDYQAKTVRKLPLVRLPETRTA
jgi:deazaflavin-dependent oxidoreductase (nitroreductase family)